jgi:predicted ester cyclase
MADLIQLAERWIQEIWQRGRVEYAEEICADDFTDYSLPETEEGDIIALQDAAVDLRAAFPDLQATVMDLYRDEDYVTLRVNFQGTHSADFLSFAPTNQRVEWESIEILHFQDDLIAERWAQSDLWEQLDNADVAFNVLQGNQAHAELIAQLADTPKQLRQAVRARGSHAATARARSTGATLGYLWRCEVDAWQHMLGRMQREDNPYWEFWDAEQYDWEAEFGATDLLSLLDAFEFRRLQTCNYLRALSDEGWARRGKHPQDGTLDVAGLMNKVLDHDRAQLVALSGVQI